MKKRILVTGGSGFIGTNIIEFYKDEHKVLNIDIKAPRNKKHQVYWKKIDLLDVELLSEAFIDFQPDFVFHMAARTDLDGETIEDYKTNIEGVENVITAINQVKSIKKVIFASSRLVCEIGYEPKDEFDYKPSTIYGESKIIGEKIIRKSTSLKTNWIIVRPTSLWGPWFDIPYKSFFSTVRKNLYFHPGERKIYKKFGFVLNSVYILDKLLKDESLLYKTVYLSDFEELEVGHWANLISQNFHQKKIIKMPYFILKIIAIIGDFSKVFGYKTPPLTTFRLNNLVTPMYFNTLEVENVVGKLPYALNEATNITCKWLKQN